MYIVKKQRTWYKDPSLKLSIISIKMESAVQGHARVKTLSIQRPQPDTTNSRKEEKYKIVGDKKQEQITPSGKKEQIRPTGNK